LWEKEEGGKKRLFLFPFLFGEGKRRRIERLEKKKPKAFSGFSYWREGRRGRKKKGRRNAMHLFIRAPWLSSEGGKKKKDFQPPL